jgi:hypothetical protein
MAFDQIEQRIAGIHDPRERAALVLKHLGDEIGRLDDKNARQQFQTQFSQDQQRYLDAIFQ